MKKALIILAILAISSIAYASPYLVCDCQDNVDQYVITFDNGTPIVSDAVTAECTNGQKRLSLDVGPLNMSDGPHHLEGIARSSIWGIHPRPLSTLPRQYRILYLA